MTERTFTITGHNSDDPAQPDGRHPAVSCDICGAWAQVLPDVAEGGDVGHFDDLGDYGTGALSDGQQLIHNALSRWSIYHAENFHTPKEHAAHARAAREVKL